MCGIAGIVKFDPRERAEDDRLVRMRDRIAHRGPDGQGLIADVRAVLAAEALRPEFNEEALPEFLANRFVASDETFFRGVRKLLPGHVLSWSPAAGLRSRRYWQPPAPRETVSPTIAYEAPVLRHLL